MSARAGRPHVGQGDRLQVAVVNTARSVLCLLLLWAMSCPAEVHAQLDVASALDGLPLGRRVGILEDPNGSLTVKDLERPEVRSSFRSSPRDMTWLGRTNSVFWLRLPVVNTSDTARVWLLELAYPHIDDLTLYVPRGNGQYTAKITGDARPFRSRDVEYFNFLFEQREPPQSERTYILRVQSSGPLDLPLFAWSRAELWQHQMLTWALFCIFYGAILVMACHGACVYLLVGQSESLVYTAYLLACVAAMFSLSGHTFQFLLPNHPQLVQHLSLACVATTHTLATLLVRTQFSKAELSYRLLTAGTLAQIVLLVPTFLLPYALAVQLIVAVTMLMAPGACYVLIMLGRREKKDARLFLLAFLCPLLGDLVSSLHHGGVVELGIARWSVQFGVLVQAVLVSSGLADKVTAARKSIETVHRALTGKVADLSVALDDARQATLRAERATAARDEFMDTINHELRTPLNAIINVPQGLKREFMNEERAVCRACKAEFVLDEGEQLAADTACPECACEAALTLKQRLVFVGDPVAARAHLLRAERSGHGLLRVVNGVLEFSRLETGRAELVLARACVPEAVRQAIKKLTRQKLVTPFSVRCEVSEDTFALADADRLGEIFGQLFHNALKFSPGAAKIVVTAAAVDNELVVSVSDQGIGIPAAHLSSVFQSFEQVSKSSTRRYGGTGLGLTICRALVVAHGGRIWIESEEGRSTTVRFTLPSAKAMAPPAASAVA